MRPSGNPSCLNSFRQGTGLRNRRFHRPSWSKMHFKKLRLPLGSHLAATGNLNLNMLLKIYFQKLKMACGLIKDIKGFLAPRTNGPRDVPPCGALSLLQMFPPRGVQQKSLLGSNGIRAICVELIRGAWCSPPLWNS